MQSQSTDSPVPEKAPSQKSGKKNLFYLCRYRSYVRAMALYVLEQNIDPQDQVKVAAVCPDIDVTIPTKTAYSRYC